MQGGVFICYRREDSAGFAGRIYDRLKTSLGRDSVFIDVDNIPAGRDFIEVLSERVGRCDALVAVIGRKWLASADNDNRRRLDDPGDFVRIEIEAALARDVPVIPVLVDGAAMPRTHDLPDALKNLARRQGVEISHNRFDSDAERLTDALARIGGEPRLARGVAAARSPTLPRQEPSAALSVVALLSGLVIVAGVAGLLYEQPGAQRDTARQEQRAPHAEVRPTPRDSKPVPTVWTSSAPNAATAPPHAVVIAADPPPDVANAAASNAARDDSSAGTVPANAPAKVGEGDAPDASGPPHWMNFQDFIADYRRQIVSSYPDKAWARCVDGAPQRAAHWSPRPPGQFFDLRGFSDKAFTSDAADMTAKGFKIQYDNIFQSCDGAKQHQTLWMKED